MSLIRSVACCALSLLPVVAAFAQAPEARESTEGLDMQNARAKMMTARGAKVAYTKKWDLSALPEYKPAQRVAGNIRVWGSNYITDSPLAGYWEAAFRKHHPDAHFELHTKTTLAAVPAFAFGVADVGIGRKVTFAEQELFERFKDRSPVAIEIMTGSFDVPGWNPGYGVVVHKDNPIAKLTMKQLDGIFGAERAGGWEGTSWRPNAARGPEENIRTWGQLGLTGEWADKPINVYGLTLRYHQATEISDLILKGSDKWNEKLKIYANFVSRAGKLERGMNDDLSADKYGIGIFAAPTTNLMGGQAPSQKILAVAATDGGPYVAYTLDSVHDRSYPLVSQMFAFADREPGKPMDPKVLEFLRFVLSREGQELVQKDGKYLPLTPELAKAQRDKLEDAVK